MVAMLGFPLHRELDSTPNLIGGTEQSDVGIWSANEFQVREI
jgi:hypothetical protein